MDAAKPQPPPQESPHPSISDIVEQDILLLFGDRQVADDIVARKDFGVKKYGTALKPFNGRDAAADVYQELLDAAVYLRQLIYEKTRMGFAHMHLLEDYKTILTLLIRCRKYGD